MYLYIYTSKERGFSLIEVIVATFIFTLTMSVVSQIFVSAFSAYHREKIIQNNLENAQFALNTLSKQLRGSSVSAFSPRIIRSYNYATGLCTRYSILTIGSVTTLYSTPFHVNATHNGCGAGSIGPRKNIMTIKDGSFFVTSSSSLPHQKKVGKVTISLYISDSVNFPAHLQTTVSLRDYEVSGL